MRSHNGDHQNGCKTDVYADIASSDESNVLVLVAEVVKIGADDQIACEYGDGEEGVDVVLAVTGEEVVECCEDCVPAQ